VLARRRAESAREPLLRSTIEPYDPAMPGVDALPVVVDGDESSDEHIGW
jgi:hypothetical protein